MCHYVVLVMGLVCVIILFWSWVWYVSLYCAGHGFGMCHYIVLVMGLVCHYIVLVMGLVCHYIVLVMGLVCVIILCWSWVWYVPLYHYKLLYVPLYFARHFVCVIMLCSLSDFVCAITLCWSFCMCHYAVLVILYVPL